MKTSKRILYYRISDDAILTINTLTGAIDLINSQVYNYLSNHNSAFDAQIDELTAQRLKRRGYLANAGTEAAMMHRIAEAYEKGKKRLAFVICPTYSCNLRCTYCFEGNLTHDNQAFMQEGDVDLIFNAIDRLMHTYSDRTHTINLFGGEPLLTGTKRFVNKVFQESRRRSLPIGIVTNGTHIHEFIDDLSLNKDIIRAVQITLDGPKEVHDKRRKTAGNRGTFETICSAINALLELQINVMVRVNVDHQNIGAVPELFTDMSARNWIGSPHLMCNLSPVQDHALSGAYEFFLTEDKLVEKVFALFRANPEFENVFRLNMFRTLGHIKSVLESSRPVRPLLYYCEANNLENVVFGPDGNLYACTECMGQDDLAIGRFRPAFKVKEAAVKMWTNRNVLTMKRCRECDIALLCGGGCAYSALCVNGDIGEPVCNRARETIFAYLSCVKDDLTRKASA